SATLTEEARETRRQQLAEFVTAGFHGDMGWLAKRHEQRTDPQGLWPEAKTVVTVAMNYGPAGDPLEVLRQGERAAISIYAQGRDYHDVMKGKLRSEEHTA